MDSTSKLNASNGMKRMYPRFLMVQKEAMKASIITIKYIISSQCMLYKVWIFYELSNTLKRVA